MRTFRDVPDEQAEEYLSEKSVWFRAMLFRITFPPMTFGEPVALVIVYASLGALFLSFLAITPFSSSTPAACPPSTAIASPRTSCWRSP